MRHLVTCLFLVSVAFVLSVPVCSVQGEEDGWVKIFNGQDLTGWKSNEDTNTFKVEDGAIVGSGNRNHLYYMEELQNFELKLDVKISKGGNSGVYVKSQWKEKSWPVTGFELQVNSSGGDPVKTGSLYNIIKFPKAPHGDDEWFNYHIICKGDALTVSVNGTVLYTYVDPMEKGGKPQDGEITERNKRISQKGYIALQQHDPKSIPAFKNIQLKKLP